jgi:uncharacterized protein (TIGR02391 family)
MGNKESAMARKLPPPEPAHLSVQQIRSAIPQLERRLSELTSLDINSLTEENYANVLQDLHHRNDDTLVHVFGHGTVDYHRYTIAWIDGTPASWSPLGGGSSPSIHERRPYIKKGIASAIGTLNSAVSMLKERLADSGDTAAARAITAYRGLDLHPEIARAASKLYQDGHYATAVEQAVKALNGLVRVRSGLDTDGMSLMERAFSPSNPIIKFNDLSDLSDKDEQKGYMMMFCGAVAGLRNPRAHAFIQDDPERAMEFIAFVSLLAKLLDEAK